MSESCPRCARATEQEDLTCRSCGFTDLERGRKIRAAINAYMKTKRTTKEKHYGRK